mmetsp:Transcript_30488/g.45121  ORF Transcript_30488/g.45121 Transcript_30488/m.45121 type:complete len:129 (+) Transcript_30488:163-549(+)
MLNRRKKRLKLKKISSSGSKGLTEIDDIFSSRSKKSESKEKEKISKQVSRTQPLSGNRKKFKLTHSRLDLGGIKQKEWADDGLGGKFNREGYTGRVEGGVKVFKAHLFNKKDFGKSAECPFDCNCCYI